MEAEAESVEVQGKPETPESREEATDWVLDGVGSGALGAAVVATFFLIVDVLAGRPFWTPGALGSAVFLGERLAPEATPLPVIVFGYTVLHGVVFLSIGLMASFTLPAARRRLGGTSGLLLAAALFASLEIFFLTFAGLFAPGLVDAFGTGRVATGNLLAAIAMAAWLVRAPFSRRA